MPVKSIFEPVTSFAPQFETLPLAENAPAWLNPLRKAAFSRFSELGIPNRHDEEWRYTNVAPIFENDYGVGGSSVVTAEALAAVPFGNLGGLRLVFVNGAFAPELSQIENAPNGIVIGSIAAHSANSHIETHLARYATFDKQPFVALNTAFLSDGAFVSIGRNVIVEDPIQLVFVSTAGSQAVISHPRTLILAGENSQATVVETYVSIGEGVTFSNAVTEVILAQNAVVGHTKIVQKNDRSFHIATMQVELNRDSNFRSQSITLGGAIVRNDHNASLRAEGCECTLDGLYFAGGKQLVDNHTSIDHALPHCNSHELYKGILDGQARGVFNGKIFVREDAQKTDAKQTNQTLLLSKEASINTKPQLEIFADDVRCTHGATIGQLSAEQLFYLRSRGIGAEEARALLTFAFAAEVVERIPVEAVRAEVLRALYRLLPGGNVIEETLGA